MIVLGISCFSDIQFYICTSKSPLLVVGGPFLLLKGLVSKITHVFAKSFLMVLFHGCTIFMVIRVKTR